jgi:hypothetical protein
MAAHPSYPTDSKGLPDYPSDKTFAEDCLVAHTVTMKYAFDLGREEPLVDHPFDHVNIARRFWAVMREARLFCIRPQDFGKINLRCKRHFFMDIVGITDHPAPEDRVAEMKRRDEDIRNAYQQHGAHHPFPGPGPFGACFFSYGTRMCFQGDIIQNYLIKEVLDAGATEFFHLGHLVSWDQNEAWAALMVPNQGILLRPAYNGEWLWPQTHEPWMLESIVASVNSHKSLTVGMKTGLAHRMGVKKLGGAYFGSVPSPYYLVHLKDELIVDAKRPSVVGPGRDWGYRWDVRGHECVRVLNGPEPLPAKDEADLKRRGYRLYRSGSPLSADDVERTSRRKVEPVSGEWVAVLSYWRDSYVKGPQGKPYIPASRI